MVLTVRVDRYLLRLLVDIDIHDQRRFLDDSIDLETELEALGEKGKEEKAMCRPRNP